MLKVRHSIYPVLLRVCSWIEFTVNELSGKKQAAVSLFPVEYHAGDSVAEHNYESNSVRAKGNFTAK